MTDSLSFPKSYEQSYDEAQQGLEQNEGVSDYVKNFVLSGLYGTAGLVGISAPPAVEAWNYKHPIGGFTAQLVGPTGYYMGAAKVGRELMAGTRLFQMIDSLGGESAWAPVIRRGLGEMAAIAPFEVGRLGATALLGNDIKNVGEDVLLGEGLTGIFGAGVGLLESAGQKVT